MKIAPLSPPEVLEISSPLMAELREVFLDMEGRAQAALSKAVREGLAPEAILDAVKSALQGPQIESVEETTARIAAAAQRPKGAAVEKDKEILPTGTIIQRATGYWYMKMRMENGAWRITDKPDGEHCKKLLEQIGLEEPAKVVPYVPDQEGEKSIPSDTQDEQVKE